MEETVKSERRIWPIHPPLLAAVPVFAVMASNLNLVPIHQAWRPLLMVVFAAMVLWGVFSLIFRNIEKGAMAASSLTLATILFAILIRFSFKDLMGIPAVMVWGLMAALLMVLLVKTKWTKVLNVVALMTFLVAGFQVASGYQYGKIASTGAGTGSVAAHDKPDVYFLILDAYASRQTMKRVFARSNDQFLEELESKGFELIANSRSNYVQTELSLAATLNMNHMVDLLEDADESKIETRVAFSELIDDSLVVKQFKEEGYEVVAITSNFPPVSFGSADVKLKTSSGMTMIEGALFQMTPFGRQKAARDSMFNQHRRTVGSALSNLQRIGGSAARPRLILAHILSPHPPFVFGPEGQELHPDVGFGFWDGSDYFSNGGNKEGYIKGYSDQSTYLENQLIQTVDMIVSSSDRQPVIIIQSDHGSKVGLDQNSLEKTDVQECFTTLNAILAPEKIQQKLYSGMTPVNTFRVILPGLFGGEMDMLPDRSFWSPYVGADRFTDVTDRIKAAD